MTDLIDDVKKRLDNIRARAAAWGQEQCIEYLENRIDDLETDIDMGGGVANDKEQLRLLKKLLKEVKNETVEYFQFIASKMTAQEAVNCLNYRIRVLEKHIEKRNVPKND